ncbi:MAG: hypothetical protein HKN80_10910, partial [Acidimicrobiia bacterium]|nr:hypothetical protein [Acidimicrobiia bacterium]
MRHLISTIIALLLLGLFLMPASAVAADMEGDFTGTAVGEAAFDLANSSGCPTPEDTPPGFGITTITDAAGTAGSGGAVSLHSVHCPLATGGITSGQMTFTMANSDEIHGTYTGTATPIPPNIGDPILVTINIALNGGTGRYAHASGAATLDAELVFEGLEDLAWPWEASWTGTVSYGVDASLQFSRSADRSEPVALDGATVNGNLYVFLTPLVPPESGAISGVEFWVGGALVHTECCAPYDMIGGTTDGPATAAWHTPEVPDGEATVTARILFDDGTSQDITATATVDNSTPLPAEWGFGYSMDADRSDARPLLQSYAVSGSVYLFVFPFDPGLSGPVDLYLDGQLIRREYEAPYDLLGGSSDRAGVALDTTTLPDGVHRLSAIAVDSNQQAAVPFVVDNTPSDVETLESFPQPGPEGIAVDPEGNLYATFARDGELRMLDPAGEWTTVTTWEVGEGSGPLGLEVDGAGNAYVAVTTFNPGNHGVYRVTHDGESVRLPGSEAIIFPNDVAFDQQGNLFVSDTVGGAIWRLAPEGAAEPWLVDPLLLGTGEAGYPVPLGANGVAWSDDTLYVANTEQGHVVSVPVNEDGSAGTPLVTSHPQFLFPDGIAVGADGRIYTALIAQSTIAALDPATGALEYFATALDGIDWASSLTFGEGALDPMSLYAVNYA